MGDIRVKEVRADLKVNGVAAGRREVRGEKTREVVCGQSELRMPS